MCSENPARAPRAAFSPSVIHNALLVLGSLSDNGPAPPVLPAVLGATETLWAPASVRELCIGRPAVSRAVAKRVYCSALTIGDVSPLLGARGPVRLIDAMESVLGWRVSGIEVRLTLVNIKPEAVWLPTVAWHVTHQ